MKSGIKSGMKSVMQGMQGMRTIDQIHVRALVVNQNLARTRVRRRVWNGIVPKSILRYKDAIEDEIYENK
jgi:nickel-dependent lactate racemase